jgi:hypothetical protein
LLHVLLFPGFRRWEIRSQLGDPPSKSCAPDVDEPCSKRAASHELAAHSAVSTMVELQELATVRLPFTSRSSRYWPIRQDGLHHEIRGIQPSARRYGRDSHRSRSPSVD